MNILTPWPSFSSIPFHNSPFWLDSFSFARHCFANVKLSNLVCLFSLPLDLLILHSFFVQWSYLFHAIHYPLIPSFDYPIFLLSYLFILLTYLLCIHLACPISPCFFLQIMLYFGFSPLTFDSKVSFLIFFKKNPETIHAMYIPAQVARTKELSTHRVKSSLDGRRRCAYA
jgi:hypothetical protein